MDNNIKERLQSVITMADSERPACKNCKSYKNGGCSFGCLNERIKITSPNYSCENFKAVYEYQDNTVAAMKDLMKDVEKVEEGLKNLELLFSGKINEEEFIDLVD